MQSFTVINGSFLQVQQQTCLSGVALKWTVEDRTMVVSWSKNISSVEAYAEFGSHGEVRFDGFDGTQRMIRLAMDSKHVRVAVTQCFPLDMVEKETIVLWKRRISWVWT